MRVAGGVTEGDFLRDVQEASVLEDRLVLLLTSELSFGA